jgi:hypothetical protein
VGINYYRRSNICACCGRFDKQHICRSLITFQAVTKIRDDPPWNDEIVIGTWADWRRVLLTEPGEIWDNYGTQVPVLEFVRRVEATDLAARRRQFDWMHMNDYPVSSTARVGAEWLCPDGFSFTTSDFS